MTVISHLLRMLLLSLALLLPACHHGRDNGGAPGFSGPTMGTTYTVRYTVLPVGLTQPALQEQVEAILADINRQMSIYDPASEISRFNRSPAGVWVPVSADFVDVIEEGMRVGRISQGAFDVSIAPLVDLWGFGPNLRADRIPSAREIDAAKKFVGQGFLRTRREPPALMKTRAGVTIDVNAIAPGFAADKVAALLLSLGTQNYLVDMSGELRLRGHNPQGLPWAIAVEKPVSDRMTVERVIHLTNQGISTSGDYHNFFELNGHRYSHEIDPRTGSPIAHDVVSVTAIAPTAMTADALSTALLVMGPVEGYTYAVRANIPALFILRRGGGFQELPTPAFRPYLEGS